MSRTHETYTEAVSNLAKQIDIEKNIVAPVGFRGVATAELFMYCFAPKHDGSVFQNTFYASEEEYKKFIVKENGGWLYNLEPSEIRKINHIHSIKMEIDRFLLK